MARKRKIPARKHHGIRDPLKQLEEREKRLANVTDNPPTQSDDQHVSYKFAQFKKTVDAVKAGKRLKRTPCGLEDKPKSTKAKQKQTKQTSSGSNGNKFRSIKQFLGETDEDYLRRVNRMTTESVREAQYEAKYGVNVIRDPKTGMITIQKRPKNEIDELLKQKRQQLNASKSGRRTNSKQATMAKPGQTLDPKVAKQLIKRAIKESDAEEISATLPEYEKDLVQFGEIVHAPPTLSTLPRKATKNETVPRPGKKQNLLLQTMMNGDNANKTQVKGPKSQGNGRTNTKLTSKSNSITKAKMRGKLKELPIATRNMLETERNKMVDLYRELRKTKTQT